MKALFIVVGMIALVFSLGISADVDAKPLGNRTGIVICAYDTTTSACDYTADGINDEEQINQALSSLPVTGGSVYLTGGHFSIGDSGVAHGGVVITKSGTHLQGSGLGTKLTLMAGTLDTNVIEVVGDGIANVVISDLWIDANRANQQASTLPAIFQSNGIRVSSSEAATGYSNASNITVRDVRVEECANLCVMMRGSDLTIEDSRFGNASNDVVELLQGPGSITNNHFEITARTGVVISTDAANDILISGNTVTITSKAVVGVGIRTWHGFRRNNVQNNIINVAGGGMLKYAMLIGTSRSIVSGNTIQADGKRIRMLITASPVLLTGNYLCYVDITINAIYNDVSGGGDLGVVIGDNILHNTTITVVE